MRIGKFASLQVCKFASLQVVQSLSNKPEEDQLPPHDDPCKLADDFGEFFCRKVDLIRNDIDAITVVPPDT